MKKFLSLTLCLLLLVPVFSSCSKPPEYTDIEARFKELVEASGEINMIFFGEGLATYERITDPKSSTTLVREDPVYDENGEPVLDVNGKQKYERHYVYEVPDDTYGTVYAYRKGYTGTYTYLYVLSSPNAEKTPFYEDEEEGIYAYVLEGYTEPEYEFFYDSDDPTDYDYVRADSKYTTVAEIKAAAEKVYSSDYLDSIYESMFVGSVSAADTVAGLSARYIEYADDDGNISLMKSNVSEAFITEIREYDFSTARIVRPANAEYITVEIESYLPSKPDERLTVRLSMIKENGQWMLDAATY